MLSLDEHTYLITTISMFIYWYFPQLFGQYLGKSLRLLLWLHHPFTCMYHIHFGLSSNILLQHIHVVLLCLGPYLYYVLYISILYFISVLFLLLPNVWVWLSYHNVSCNVSETSVVLPGPASMNPLNVHITL